MCVQCQRWCWTREVACAAWGRLCLLCNDMYLACDAPVKCVASSAHLSVPSYPNWTHRCACGVEQETKGKTLEEIEAIFKTGGKGE